MKNILTITLVLIAFAVQAQVIGKKKREEQRFNEMMTEINELYSKGRFKAYLMADAAKIHPEDITLNKMQATYYLEELKNPSKALPHINRILADTPADSTWTESRLITVYALYNAPGAEADQFAIFNSDLTILQDRHNVNRSNLDIMKARMEERKAEIESIANIE